MITSICIFSSSSLTCYSFWEGTIFLAWQMLFFQRIKLLFIFANIKNMHILKWLHISNANQNCFILNMFSILSVKIISWIEHRFVELSTDLQEVYQSEFISFIKNILKQKYFHQNLAKPADENWSVKNGRNFKLMFESPFSFDLVNNHLTAINDVICFRAVLSAHN